MAYRSHSLATDSPVSPGHRRWRTRRDRWRDCRRLPGSGLPETAAPGLLNVLGPCIPGRQPVTVPAQLAYSLMTEKELDKHVRKLCHDLGLAAYHTLDSRGSSAGFPDWTVAGPGGVLFAECKSARGTLRPEQCDWRD